MIALIATVLTASLLGSVHCAAMCGPFVALATCGGPIAPQVHVSRRLGGSPLAVAVAYHAGRLCNYLFLGALAGVLGAALNLGAGMLGVQRVAAVLAGSVTIVLGGIVLARVAGVPIHSAPLPLLVRQLLSGATRLASTLPPVARAGLIGLLTTLLPCGWLYAFVIIAAGTASPIWGAVTMAAFWLGTVPLLVGLGIGVRALAIPLRRHAPVLTGMALIVVGALTAAGRLTIDSAALQQIAAVPSGIAAATAQATDLSSSDLPCCHSTNVDATLAHKGDPE